MMKVVQLFRTLRNILFIRTSLTTSKISYIISIYSVKCNIIHVYTLHYTYNLFLQCPVIILESREVVFDLQLANNSETKVLKVRLW